MIVLKEEVYIHRALETGDAESHVGKSQGRLGSRNERRAWPRAFIGGFHGKEWVRQGR